MDADTLVAEARAAANRLLATDAEINPLYHATLADELSRHLLSLDAWLSTGQPLPARWAAGRTLSAENP